MFCSDCGSKVQETAKFCSSCGGALAQNDAPDQLTSLPKISTGPDRDASRPKLDFPGFLILVISGVLLLSFVWWLGTQIFASDSEDPAVTIVPIETECEKTFSRASVTLDSDAAEVLLVDTLRKCKSVAEWWDAAELFPTAFAATRLSGGELDLMCDRYPEVGICRMRP
jgi:hypothetical protein